VVAALRAVVRSRIVTVLDLSLACQLDLGLGDLCAEDRVVGLDVERPDDAPQDDRLGVLVRRQGPVALDDQVAVRQDLLDDGAHPGVDLVLVGRLSVPFRRGVGARTERAEQPREEVDDEVRDEPAAVRLRGLRRGGVLRDRLLLDDDRHDVADVASDPVGQGMFFTL
jgi:hypothetical protein